MFLKLTLADPLQWYPIQPPLIMGPYFIIILKSALASQLAPRWAVSSVKALRRGCPPRLIRALDLALGPYAGMLLHINRMIWLGFFPIGSNYPNSIVPRNARRFTL